VDEYVNASESAFPDTSQISDEEEAERLETQSALAEELGYEPFESSIRNETMAGIVEGFAEAGEKTKKFVFSDTTTAPFREVKTGVSEMYDFMSGLPFVRLEREYVRIPIPWLDPEQVDRWVIRQEAIVDSMGDNLFEVGTSEFI